MRKIATGTPSTVVQPQDALVRLRMRSGGNRPASRWIRHLPAPGATFNGSTRAFAPVARRQPDTAVAFGGGCRPVGDLHFPGAEVDEHRRVEGEAVAGHVRARAFAGTAAVAPGGLQVQRAPMTSGSRPLPAVGAARDHAFRSILHAP